MTERRVDLSAIDPDRGGASIERLVGAINARAAAELTRRALPHGPMGFVVRWAMPTFATAAVLAAVSLMGVLRVDRPEPVASASPTLGQALLPEPASTWVAEDREPTRLDFIMAMEDDI